MNPACDKVADIKPFRWKRRLQRLFIVLIAVVIVGALLIRNHVRTLASLQRVPGTNAYVMDYYLDYHLEEIEESGMDVANIEDSYIKTFFPDVILPIAKNVKRAFIPEKIVTTDAGQHCSSLFFKSAAGTSFFARNQDYHNDAFLILRIHDSDSVASIALIDLQYLNLNRSDLDETNLIQRIPLLFAPYYVFDGINRHGIAVGIMSVDDCPVKPGRNSSRPDVTNTTLMRIILDNARTTEEALAIAEYYNVHFVEAGQHVLIGDADGNSGILEHVDGALRFVERQNEWQVCTNHQMFENSELENDSKCDRYRVGSAVAELLGESSGMNEVQNAIRTMSVDGWTMWTAVYNLTDGEIAVIYKNATDRTFEARIPRVE